MEKRNYITKMFHKYIFPVAVILLFIPNLFAVKIGYAFSGGGARGMAQIGVLKVMEEVGLKPQYISGSSIGALIGGLYAMGYNATEIESIFVNTNWTSLFQDNWNREDLSIAQKRWAPYGNATFRIDEHWNLQLPQSVIMGNKINLELFKLFAPASEIKSFNDLPIPFSAVATNLVNGKMVVFQSGSLMQAVRASLSIPSIMQPFPLNGELYIDGGISQNLPGRQVKDLGADFVIGIKANSSLHDKDDLDNLIKVLDQTVNIGMTNRVQEELAYCDYILEPDLDAFSATDFRRVKEIIQTGEDYARAHIDELYTLKDSIGAQETITTPNTLPLHQKTKYKFNHISIQGNENISSYIIKNYLALNLNESYSVNDIIRAVNRAWNSQLLEMIYPVIQKDGTDCQLNIIVKERERKHLVIDFCYDKENEFVAGAVLSLQNFLMKNSNLLAEVKLGGKNELNVDFVKNFGQLFGAYYRIFPYLNEKRIYFYDDNHDKESSVRSLEYGLTSGIGMFAGKAMVLEGYGFSSATRLYKEVSQPDSMENRLKKSTIISGLGLKAYHESLDDYTFPTKGTKMFAQISFARNNILSEQNLNKLKIDYEIYHPLSSKFSACLGAKIGSHFKQNDQNSLDPFYLGGLSNFAGYALYDKSAPFFELLQTELTFKSNKNLFLTAKAQALNYNDTDAFIPDKGFITCGVIQAGYKTYWGPIKLAFAVSEDNSPQYYLEVGYTDDIFHFSRR